MVLTILYLSQHGVASIVDDDTLTGSNSDDAGVGAEQVRVASAVPTHLDASVSFCFFLCVFLRFLLPHLVLHLTNKPLH